MAERVTRHESTDFDKADAILKYVQNNYSLEKGKRIDSAVNIDKVWQAKSGHAIDLSVLLTEMLNSVGLETRHYVTRVPSAGGFDPEMQDWGQLHTPLVSVIIEGREYVAFPFWPAMRLGEYPFNYEGLYALSLEQGKPVKLPPSVHDKAHIGSTVELSLDSPNSGEHIWRYRMADHFGAIFRGVFKEASQYDLKKFGNIILDNYSEQHSLKKIDRDYINRHTNIGIDIKFQNKNLSIENQSGRMISFRPFFRKYFAENLLVKDRGYENNLTLVFDEEIFLMDFVKNNGVLNFACEELENRMFKVECSQQIYAQDATASRTVTVKKVKLSADEIQTALKDITKLNRISESYVTFSK